MEEMTEKAARSESGTLSGTHCEARSPRCPAPPAERRPRPQPLAAPTGPASNRAGPFLYGESVENPYILCWLYQEGGDRHP